MINLSPLPTLSPVSKTRLDVLFLAMGTKTPASRFRVQQFFPYFQQHGIQPTLQAGYGDGYNVHAGRPYSPLYKLLCRFKRAALTVSEAGDHDLVFLQRTALPFTSLPERLAAQRNPRVIFDFDDAIFLNGAGVPQGRAFRTFREAVRVSSHIFAGNAYLAAHTEAPEKTTVLPTVIDTDQYVPAEREAGEAVVIGWMGTSSNFHQLQRIVPSLERVLKARPHARFRLVSNAQFEPLEHHPQVEQIRWSAEHELALLQSFDVGIMPLADTAWSRGKCGFKLIQYMAVGKPVVASAVGANVEIVPEGQAGYLIPEGDDWTEPILALVDSVEDRERMGARARHRIVDAYSIESVLPQFVDVFARVAR